MRRLVLRLSLPLCWSFSHLCSLYLAFCCSIYLVGPCQVSFFVLYFGLCSHLYFAHPCPHLRYQLLSFLSAFVLSIPTHLGHRIIPFWLDSSPSLAPHDSLTTW